MFSAIHHSDLVSESLPPVEVSTQSSRLPQHHCCGMGSSIWTVLVEAAAACFHPSSCISCTMSSTRGSEVLSLSLVFSNRRIYSDMFALWNILISDCPGSFMIALESRAVHSAAARPKSNVVGYRNHPDSHCSHEA